MLSSQMAVSRRQVGCGRHFPFAVAVNVSPTENKNRSATVALSSGTFECDGQWRYRWRPRCEYDEDLTALGGCVIEDAREGEMAMQRRLGLRDSRESAVCGGSNESRGGGGESRGLWVGNGGYGLVICKCI